MEIFTIEKIKSMRYIRIIFFFIFISLKMNAQQCGDNMVNVSYRLNDVAYVSDETFIAIGNGGKILKTTDAGITWAEINCGALVDLFKIQFVTDNIGYIIGAYDHLFKTEDSGNHWFPIKINNPGYPYCENLFFITPDSGFVCGGDGKIFKTTDGGRSWQYSSNGYADLFAIYFMDKNTGYACGSSNTLLKTTDNGKNWQALDMSGFGFNITFRKIIFIDEFIGYLLGNNGVIIKTTDGGGSWTKISTISTDYAVTMNFINKNIGYVVGGWSGTTFYRTMNGGLTWQPVSHGYGGSITGIAQNKTGNKGVVVGDGAGFGYTSQPGRFILYFDESNNNWPNSCFLNGYIDFRDVAFVDNKTGYLFGGYYLSHGVAYKTYDGGITWNQLPFNPANNIYKSCVINKDTIYITADSIYKTTDGGKNWKAISSLTGKMIFNNDLGFINDFYNIFRSTNAGDSWEKVCTTSNFFTDIALADTKTIYAVGYDVAYKSVDSGKIWTSCVTLPSKYYKSVFFQNKDTGFIGDDHGTLYKTMDGGINWATIVTGTDMAINVIKFKNDTDGYIIANNDGGGTSEIYLTNDGGITWEKRFGQISENVFSTCTTNNGDVYFAGERGTLMQITKNISPSMSGYILGKQSIVKGTPVKYSIFAQPGISYNWTVSNNQSFSKYKDSIIINFAEKGKFKLSVTASNACGTGLTNYYEVIVNDSLNTNTVNVSIGKIEIYPNPFSDNLNISISNPADKLVNINIYDLQGKLIKSINASGYGYDKVMDLNLSDLDKGIYLLKIFQENKTYITKILKI